MIEIVRWIRRSGYWYRILSRCIRWVLDNSLGFVGSSMSISATDALGNWYKIWSSVPGSTTESFLNAYLSFHSPESISVTGDNHKRLISVNSVVSVSWTGDTGYEYDVLAGATTSEIGGDEREMDTIHPSETISETGEDGHLDYMVGDTSVSETDGEHQLFSFYERATVSETGGTGHNSLGFVACIDETHRNAK